MSNHTERTDRPRLQRRDGERLRFTATVEHFGTRSNYHGFPEPTVLLRDVRFDDNGSPATDHIWFVVGKTIARLGLRSGETVAFDARISPYIKGYVNRREFVDERELSYKLNRPTRWGRV